MLLPPLSPRVALKRHATICYVGMAGPFLHDLFPPTLNHDKRIRVKGCVTSDKVARGTEAKAKAEAETKATAEATVEAKPEAKHQWNKLSHKWVEKHPQNFPTLSDPRPERRFGIRQGACRIDRLARQRRTCGLTQCSARLFWHQLCFVP